MRLSILLFDGFTALDAVGGYEVLVSLPNVEVEFVAAHKGLVATDSRRLGVMAYRTFDEVEATDILYVPGGPGVVTMLEDQRFLEYLRRLDATSTWTIGVCNGVALLAAAGLLNGRAVTTNWSWRERVAAYGPIVMNARYHEDGKYITAAGVSASIDAALFFASTIAGERMARLIQLGIEYFPDPPFATTTADEAPQEAKDAIRRFESTTAMERLRLAPRPF